MENEDLAEEDKVTTEEEKMDKDDNHDKTFPTE